MRRFFTFSLLAGFVGTLAAAHFVPWVSHVRLPSQTSVVANGGRAEGFVIRLPADRIQAAGPPELLLRAGALVADVAWSAGPAPLLEHFKIRDRAGNVIGVAARHWLETSDGPVTTWALSIPSRGTLILAGRGESSGAIETALAARGYRTGTAWNGEAAIALGDGAMTRTVTASREFAGLAVEYTETWNITGVSASGEIRGTVELATIGRRGP
jgi:hypothetical protein